MERLMELLDKMSEEDDEISIKDAVKEGEKEDLKNVESLIRSAFEQGLVLDLENGKIQKIAKRMFW